MLSWRRGNDNKITIFKGGRQGSLLATKKTIRKHFYDIVIFPLNSHKPGVSSTGVIVNAADIAKMRHEW